MEWMGKSQFQFFSDCTYTTSSYRRTTAANSAATIPTTADATASCTRNRDLHRRNILVHDEATGPAHTDTYTNDNYACGFNYHQFTYNRYHQHRGRDNSAGTEGTNNYKFANNMQSMSQAGHIGEWNDIVRYATAMEHSKLEAWKVPAELPLFYFTNYH
jgi:hypothetical protein